MKVSDTFLLALGGRGYTRTLKLFPDSGVSEEKRERDGRGRRVGRIKKSRGGRTFDVFD